METDDTTDWMNDDDWLMQDSQNLPSAQFSKSIVILTPPPSPSNIWEIISSFTPLKHIISLRNMFS